MNKTELLTVLREMVKNELKELLNTREGRALLREIIGKEVRIEVDKLLTEMEHSDSSKEIIQESPKNQKLSRMVERGELPPKGVPKKESQTVAFTKNQKLNSMLNQTLEAIRNGKETMPSTEGTAGQVAMLREQYEGQPKDEMGAWPTMPTGGMNAQNFNAVRPQMEESTGKSVVSMLPDKDVNGNPLMVNPNALPDHVSKALTRDYRKAMKKVDEKRG